MAQRIQAPMNAGLCLIISREGLSMVPQKKRQESERWKEMEKHSRRKTEGKGKSKYKVWQELWHRQNSKREKEKESDTSLWPHYFSCGGFCVNEKNFDKILVLYIFSPLLALKVMWNIVWKMNRRNIK